MTHRVEFDRATAHSRSLPNNDKRLELERSAGELLKPAA